MCCLFGFMDCGHTLTGWQKGVLARQLSIAAEARGTDATGIAYNSGGRLCVYKRPLPAHKLHLFIPGGVETVMGHTRLTTQGCETHNCNNHPFLGTVRTGPFAPAHNSVLRNVHALRRSLRLPKTRIETDSYVAVQLLEQKKALDFDSLRDMAEQVEGSFSFTVLDGRDTLYIVKGDNPLCLYHYPRMGLYLYASTEDIVKRALVQMRFFPERPERVALSCGDILRIDPSGARTMDSFDSSQFYQSRYSFFSCSSRKGYRQTPEEEYLEELKSVAGAYGYAPESIDELLSQGFTTDELEELLYCGEL